MLELFHSRLLVGGREQMSAQCRTGGRWSSRFTPVYVQGIHAGTPGVSPLMHESFTLWHDFGSIF